MKKKIAIVIIVIFIMMMCTSAYADEDYFTMEHYTDPTAIASVGGDVTLTVKIAHDSNSAYVMSDVKIYKGNNLIISFGNIYAGQEMTKSGRLNVLASETDGVDLTLKYSESGQRQIVKDFKVEFTQIEDAKPVINFKCNLSKTTGESDDVVNLTYRVENVGNVHIYDLKIEDGAFGTIKELPVLKTGQNTQTVYTSKINDGFTSVPSITYTVGDVTYKEELDPVVVKAGNPALELKVTTNKMTAAPGETITISCNISNPGTSDLKNVIITEDTAGELFNIDGLVAGESQTLSYEVTVNENTTLNITAIGDNGSEKEWVAKETLDIVVDDGLKLLDIKIEASASSNLLEFPGIVIFNIVVENTGNEIYKDLKVSDKDGQVVEEIRQLVPGKSQFQVNVNVSQSGTYSFVLSVPSETGETQEISTTPIDITVHSDDGDKNTDASAQPAASFTPTEFGEDSSEPFTNSSTLLLLMILFGLVLFALIASLIRRIRR